MIKWLVRKPRTPKDEELKALRKQVEFQSAIIRALVENPEFYAQTQPTQLRQVK